MNRAAGQRWREKHRDQIRNAALQNPEYQERRRQHRRLWYRRKKLGLMTPTQFARLVDTRGLDGRALGISGRARDALRLVMVDGLRACDAAQKICISESSISKALKRLEIRRHLGGPELTRSRKRP
jgi:predicted DNA-binding protein (UPF0251 family)